MNRKEVEGDMMVRGNLGHRDHETIELSILREKRKGVSITAILDLVRSVKGPGCQNPLGGRPEWQRSPGFSRRKSTGCSLSSSAKRQADVEEGRPR